MKDCFDIINLGSGKIGTAQLERGNSNFQFWRQNHELDLIYVGFEVVVSYPNLSFI